MKRAFLACALILAGALFTPRAEADEPALLGLFEGHGIAPPADPVRARAAIAMAQRIHDQCGSLYQQRAGGTATATGSCKPRKGPRASLGRDAAAAILDVLDEPRRPGQHGTSTFSALIDDLIGTGREDVVPVLITALDRMDARKKLPDPRASEFGWSDASTIDHAIAQLAYVERYEQPWALSLTGGDMPKAIAGWRAWWAENKSKTRATWKVESVARARAALARATGDGGVEPALVLAEYPETKREGIAALKRVVRSAACAQGCYSARDFLTKLEPRGRWALPVR